MKLTVCCFLCFRSANPHNPFLRPLHFRLPGEPIRTLCQELVTQWLGIIELTLTTPGCPLHESIGEGVEAALQEIPRVIGGEVHLVWDPPWDPSRLTAEGRHELGWEIMQSLFLPG